MHWYGSHWLSGDFGHRLLGVGIVYCVLFIARIAVSNVEEQSIVYTGNTAVVNTTIV